MKTFTIAERAHRSLVPEVLEMERRNFLYDFPTYLTRLGFSVHTAGIFQQIAMTHSTPWFRY